MLGRKHIHEKLRAANTVASNSWLITDSDGRPADLGLGADDEFATAAAARAREAKRRQQMRERSGPIDDAIDTMVNLVRSGRMTVQDLEFTYRSERDQLKGLQASKGDPRAINRLSAATAMRAEVLQRVRTDPTMAVVSPVTVNEARSLRLPTNGSELREFNHCHSPADGKFCSAPGDGSGGGSMRDKNAARGDGPFGGYLDPDGPGEDLPRSAPKKDAFADYLAKKGRQQYDTEGRITGQAPAIDPAKLSSASVSSLAMMASRNWGSKVNYAAKPYLSAMRSLDSANDAYGADSGQEIIARFLANAGSWRGPVAKQIKAELKQRIGEGPKAGKRALGRKAAELRQNAIRAAQPWNPAAFS